LNDQKTPISSDETTTNPKSPSYRVRGVHPVTPFERSGDEDMRTSVMLL
jgi:hypothetical protein